MLVTRMARALSESTGLSFRWAIWILIWAPFFCAFGIFKKPGSRIKKGIFITLSAFPYAICFLAGIFLLPPYLEKSHSRMLLARMVRALSESTDIPFRESFWIILCLPVFCMLPLYFFLLRKWRAAEK